ncbi:MAG: YciI family protein [Bacteroidota bacterium]
MKKTVFTFLFALLSSFCFSQQSPDEFEMKEGDTTYIMKKYYLVLLKRGTKAKEYTKEELTKIQNGHLANINKLAQQGYLDIAGPMDKDEDLRGIFIIKNVKNEEEAKKLVDTDPAVIAGRLSYEIHPWWAAKGSCLK